ncbi:MAG: hypothetical protein EBS91_05825 [Betaproteobacteria bacterium]|nr:hypothetical protein [Betaproteobacteria bacterium]NCA24118.1 hypothetical protein [Betaproteobacteria bacterium]
MNINAAFPSTYLKAADLQGKRVTLTMSRVQLEEVGGEHKPVLYFEGTDRGIVLNKTNAAIIAEMYGPETDEWGGNKIVVYAARVEFQGRIVDAIRVHLSRPAAASQAPLQTAPAATGARPATPHKVPVSGNGTAHQQPRAVSNEDDQIPF